MTGSVCEFRSSWKQAKAFMASASSVLALAVPQVGHAQAQTPANTGDQSLQGNEIVVTARKQNETLQEVPVTVSVLGKSTIKDYHVEHMADVSSRVPTLNVQVGGSGSGGAISLRGVGSSAISAAFDSAVAFDFDGVQVSTMRMVQAGFFDTQQIEVLKGPQSLYFGKSATAGVLSIKSADPTPNWEAEAEGSYEFEKHGWTFGGHVSGPLSDTLGIRMAAQYSDVSHFVELQQGTPAVNQFRGLRDFVGRLTLAWQPLSNFKANFKFQYTRDTNDGAIQQSAIYCGANGRADEVWLFSGAVAFPAGYNCNDHSGKYFLPDTAPALAGSVPLPSAAKGFNGVPFGRTDIYFARLRFDLDISKNLTLTSNSGFLNLSAIDVDNYSYGGIGPAFSPIGNFLNIPSAAFFAANFPALAATNGPGIPGGVGTSDPVNKLTQYSQEARLASHFDGPINFMVGGYYENRKFTFDTSQNAVNISMISPDPITGYTFDYRKIATTKADAYSVFGSLTFKPTEHIELSGGVRYSEETKTNTISIPFMHAYLAAVGFTPSGFFSGPIHFHDKNWSPEVTVRYEVNPDFNVFASYKTGFKSGGIDNSALPSNQLLGFASPDPAVRAATAAGLVFKSEKAKGGEVGFKSQLANRTITLNGTVFYYQFDGLQVQNFNATTVQFVTLNAGRLRTQGVDLEGRWQTPLQGLVLSGNLTYLDAKYTKDFITPGADGVFGTADDINLKGRDKSGAPRWAGNIAADFSTPVGSGLRLSLGGNMKYSDKYYTADTSFGDYVQRAYVTFDARISVGATNDRWTISLIGNNIGDKIYTVNSGGRPFLAPPNPYGVPTGDDIILNQNVGRQVFVQARIRY